MEFESTQVIYTSCSESEEEEDKLLRKPVAFLHFTSNPDGAEEEQYPLFKGENTIGRKSECTVHLNNKALSKEHAVIEIQTNSYLIYDLGSSNRTKKGQRVLKPHVRYDLQDGDRISFANLECYFKLEKQERKCDSDSENGSESVISNNSTSENPNQSSGNGSLHPINTPFNYEKLRGLSTLQETKGKISNSSLLEKNHSDQENLDSSTIEMAEDSSNASSDLLLPQHYGDSTSSSTTPSKRLVIMESDTEMSDKEEKPKAGPSPAAVILETPVAPKTLAVVSVQNLKDSSSVAEDSDTDLDDIFDVPTQPYPSSYCKDKEDSESHELMNIETQDMSLASVQKEESVKENNTPSPGPSSKFSDNNIPNQEIEEIDEISNNIESTKLLNNDQAITKVTKDKYNKVLSKEGLNEDDIMNLPAQKVNQSEDDESDNEHQDKSKLDISQVATQKYISSDNDETDNEDARSVDLLDLPTQAYIPSHDSGTVDKPVETKIDNVLDATKNKGNDSGDETDDELLKPSESDIMNLPTKKNVDLDHIEAKDSIAKPGEIDIMDIPTQKYEGSDNEDDQSEVECNADISELPTQKYKNSDDEDKIDVAALRTLKYRDSEDGQVTDNVDIMDLPTQKYIGSDKEDSQSEDEVDKDKVDISELPTQKYKGSDNEDDETQSSLVKDKVDLSELPTLPLRDSDEETDDDLLKDKDDLIDDKQKSKDNDEKNKELNDTESSNAVKHAEKESIRSVSDSFVEKTNNDQSVETVQSLKESLSSEKMHLNVTKMGKNSDVSDVKLLSNSKIRKEESDSNSIFSDLPTQILEDAEIDYANKSNENICNLNKLSKSGTLVKQSTVFSDVSDTEICSQNTKQNIQQLALQIHTETDESAKTSADELLRDNTEPCDMSLCSSILDKSGTGIVLNINSASGKIAEVADNKTLRSKDILDDISSNEIFLTESDPHKSAASVSASEVRRGGRARRGRRGEVKLKQPLENEDVAEVNKRGEKGKTLVSSEYLASQEEELNLPLQNFGGKDAKKSISSNKDTFNETEQTEEGPRRNQRPLRGNTKVKAKKEIIDDIANQHLMKKDKKYADKLEVNSEITNCEESPSTNLRKTSRRKVDVTTDKPTDSKEKKDLQNSNLKENVTRSSLRKAKCPEPSAKDSQKDKGLSSNKKGKQLKLSRSRNKAECVNSNEQEDSKPQSDNDNNADSSKVNETRSLRSPKKQFPEINKDQQSASKAEVEKPLSRKLLSTPQKESVGFVSLRSSQKSSQEIVTNEINIRASSPRKNPETPSSQRKISTRTSTGLSGNRENLRFSKRRSQEIMKEDSSNLTSEKQFSPSTRKKNNNAKAEEATSNSNSCLKSAKRNSVSKSENIPSLESSTEEELETETKSVLQPRRLSTSNRRTKKNYQDISDNSHSSTEEEIKTSTPKVTHPQSSEKNLSKTNQLPRTNLRFSKRKFQDIPDDTPSRESSTDEDGEMSTPIKSPLPSSEKKLSKTNKLSISNLKSSRRKSQGKADDSLNIDISTEKDHKRTPSMSPQKKLSESNTVPTSNLRSSRRNSLTILDVIDNAESSTKEDLVSTTAKSSPRFRLSIKKQGSTPTQKIAQDSPIRQSTGGRNSRNCHVSPEKNIESNTYARSSRQTRRQLVISENTEEQGNKRNKNTVASKDVKVKTKNRETVIQQDEETSGTLNENTSSVSKNKEKQGRKPKQTRSSQNELSLQDNASVTDSEENSQNSSQVSGNTRVSRRGTSKISNYADFDRRGMTSATKENSSQDSLKRAKTKEDLTIEPEKLSKTVPNKNSSFTINSDSKSTRQKSTRQTSTKGSDKSVLETSMKETTLSVNTKSDISQATKITRSNKRKIIETEKEAQSVNTSNISDLSPISVRSSKVGSRTRQNEKGLDETDILTWDENIGSPRRSTPKTRQSLQGNLEISVQEAKESSLSRPSRQRKRTTPVDESSDISSSKIEPVTKKAVKRGRIKDKEEEEAEIPAKKSVTPTTTGKSTSRKSTENKMKVCAMFTGVVDKAGEKILKDLGGKLVDSVDDCTHLITDKVRRTFKFLCIVARGRPVVTCDWLKHCKTANNFIDCSPYIVKDKASEQQFGFQLSKALTTAIKQPLLAGYSIHVTSNVKPDPTQMKLIIECAGGKYLNRMPNSKSDNTVVISCPEDLKLCNKALAAGLPIVEAEFILTGILRQEVDINSFNLLNKDSNESVKSSPSPAKRARKKR